MVGRILTTLLAWLAAFLTVMAVLTLFGTQLQSQSLAVGALAMSGVLAVVMANVVMPGLAWIIGRWLRPRPPEDVPSKPRRADEPLIRGPRTGG